MPINDFSLVGERRVGLKFDQFPQQAHDALLTAIRALTSQLETLVQARVPVDSGKLLSDVQAFVDDAPDRIAGKVKVIANTSTEIGKAAALEYGAHTPFTVKAHQMRLGHFWSLAVTPTVVMIAAFSRTPNIAAHDFLRGPLDEIQDDALAALAGALTKAADA